MIQHTRYCDRCGNEIIDSKCSTVIEALKTLSDIAQKILDGKGFPKYYVGIKDGPELVMKVETKGTKKIYSVFVIANYHGVQMTLPINDAEAVKEWIRIERSSEAE